MDLKIDGHVMLVGSYAQKNLSTNSASYEKVWR